MISDLGMYKKSCLHAFHYHHQPTCVHPLLDEVFPMKCNVPRSPTWQVDWGSQDAAVHPLAFTTSTGGDIRVQCREQTHSRHCTRLFRFNSLPYEFFWYSYVCGKHIVMLGNRWGIKSRVATTNLTTHCTKASIDQHNFKDRGNSGVCGGSRPFGEAYNCGGLYPAVDFDRLIMMMISLSVFQVSSNIPHLTINLLIISMRLKHY